jgi:hypothetical protein
MIGCNISVAFYTPNAGGNANRASTLAKDEAAAGRSCGTLFWW